MVCCAFILSDKIQEVSESVVATEFDDVSNQLSKDAIDYFDYFESTYIGRQVRGRRQTPRIHPNKWSQYQSVLSRQKLTNNCVEGWNNAWSQSSLIHPNI